MQRPTKYQIISAVSTVLIMASIFIASSIDYGSLFPPMPLQTSEPELDVPLDEMMKDLSEISSTEKINPEAVKTTPAKPLESNDKTASENVEEEHAAAAEREKNQDLMKEIAKIEEVPQKKLKVEKIEAKQPDSIVIPEAIKKIIEEQNLANNNTNIVKNKNTFHSYAERYQFYQKNYRAIRNFIAVYPYAVRTRQIIDSLNVRLAATSNKSEQKKMINETEKLLFKQYEGAVRKMTTSQGRILLKMIARETNKSGYQIIKDFKGGFSATFWYGVGKLFSTDLKTEYHKEKEDSVYEEILNRYESGEYK